MAEQALVLEIGFLEGRYHGAGDWPPAPFRVFQALVAGAYGGRWAAEPEADKDAAFGWLEGLAPPDIAAPGMRPLSATTYYVPNNDTDAVRGDENRLREIRAGKAAEPKEVMGNRPLVYVWHYDAPNGHAATICRLAERLYALGRGVDPAFARAWETDAARAAAYVAALDLPVARPSGAGAGGQADQPCPQPGSLASLKARHEARTQRFTQSGRTTLFRQPPKPRFRPVAYDRPPQRRVFALMAAGGERFYRWPQTDAAALVERVRDLAAARLAAALPDQSASIERYLIGRNADSADKQRRIRLLPLPSIGTGYTDPAIRRLLVEVPPDCPLAAGDVTWALAGPAVDADPETGELPEQPGCYLAERAGDGMAGHYRIGLAGESPAATCWHSVTPVALPVRRPKGRMGGQGRALNEAEAGKAVRRALRQAGVDAEATEIAVQREPWRHYGERAERFARPPRFPARQLWHVRLRFAERQAGPLVLGNGRFLGLGLCAPEPDPLADAVAFALPARPAVPTDQAQTLLQGLRRALMALARTADGGVEPLFAGHSGDSAPARPGDHRHVYLAALDRDGSGYLDQVIVAAPWQVDRSWTPEAGLRQRFDQVTRRLATLRVRGLGRLALDRAEPPPEAFGPAKHWISRTAYRPTRHPKGQEDPGDAIAADIARECDRRGLPRPEVTVRSVHEGPRGGLSARLALAFRVAVAGPLLLGQSAHKGGGLFVAADNPPAEGR